jgi:hypothetical protein
LGQVQVALYTYKTYHLKHVAFFRKYAYDLNARQGNSISIDPEVQGGSNMAGTDYALFTHKSVPVIFEPPCTNISYEDPLSYSVSNFQ